MEGKMGEIGEKRMEIIMPHLFRMDITKMCLDAIPDSNKIILIDISTTGEAKNYCENRKKHIQYVRGPGYPNQWSFAKMSNEGAKLCKGDFFIIMSNDILLNKGVIEKIDEEINKCDEKVGILGPCRGMIPILPINVYRKKCFENIDGFDERFYPSCGEDQDFFVRMAKKDWKYKCILMDYLHVEGGHHCRIEDPIKQFNKFVNKWGFPPSGPRYYEIINKMMIK